MTTNNKISTLVYSQLPFWTRNDHPTFVAFLEAYYEYMEQEGKTVERGKNVLNYPDIDKTIPEFAEKLYSEFLALIPKNTVADRDILLKNIQDFYRARGTEKALNFVLRIMTGLESDVYYPKKDILRASDGKWYIQRSLRVSNTHIDGVANSSLAAFSNYANRRICGNTSNASAIVERVDRFYESGSLVDEIIISSQQGNFFGGEKVCATFPEGGVLKTITSDVFAGIVNSITVVNGGSEYNIGDPVIIESNTGIGGAAVVADVTSGNISSLAVQSGGAGFQANSFLLFSGGGGSGANGYVVSVDTSGNVHPNSYNIAFSTIALEANTPLSNAVYTNLSSSNANVTLLNALSYFTISNVGPIQAVFLASRGAGYLSVPGVTALANTTLESLGILGRMEIIDGGLGYVANDEIEFINVPGGFGIGGRGYVSANAANGMITEVRFKEMVGEITGGVGYDQSFPPKANVISGTGTGANVVVTAVLGSGEDFNIGTGTIGSILRIDVSSRGSGYEDAIINLTQSGDGTAQAVASLIQGVFTYPGRYLNDDGHLSSYNFLQDRDYYQNFSYVVRVKESLAKYQKAVFDLTHPAGMKLFGERLFDAELRMETPSDANTAGYVRFTPGEYVKVNANVQVALTSHGLNPNDNVYLEFTSGNFSNVSNGLFMVTTATVSTFNVVSSVGNTTTGNVEVGITVRNII
jgi:hypothetical protein